ncbi:MAG: hypothetical protein H7833_10630 [Magnetococcus sp. DMHC-1]
MPASVDPLENIRILHQGREQLVPLATVVDRIRSHANVVLDLGCGDARHVQTQARLDPDTLFVGVDLVADNMRKVSNQANRKPARGGTPNLLLLVADALTLPISLAHSADRVSIICPWGALLRGVVLSDPLVLSRLAMPLKPGGRMHIRLNLHTFQEHALRERLHLPTIHTEAPDANLLAGLQQAGLDVVRWEMAPDKELNVRTTWGQRLRHGSRRDILDIEVCPRA